ncbi:unnamed protein product [Gordionus sp. m RMFG-2023]
MNLTPIETIDNISKDINYCEQEPNEIFLYDTIFYGYISTILIILGIFGNYFNYCIFSESSKSNLGLYYMKIIALLDFCVCVISIEIPVINLAEKYGLFIAVDFDHVWFQVYISFILTNSLMKTSSLLILLVCTERYLFIYNSDLHFKWKKRGWIKAMPWVCFLVSFILCLPQVLIHTVVYCFDKRLMSWRYTYDIIISRPKLLTFYTVVREFVLTLLPLAVALCFNAELLRAFYKYYYRPGNITTTTSVDVKQITPARHNIQVVRKKVIGQMASENFQIINKKSKVNPHKIPMSNEINSNIPVQEGRIKGREMLVLLFSFVAFYAFFILPISILTILYPFIYKNCHSEPCLYRILICTFNTLELCHYSLSFYLYLIVDSKFRVIFHELLFCNKLVGPIE